MAWPSSELTTLGSFQGGGGVTVQVSKTSINFPVLSHMILGDCPKKVDLGCNSLFLFPFKK